LNVATRAGRELFKLSYKGRQCAVLMYTRAGRVLFKKVLKGLIIKPTIQHVPE